MDISKINELIMIAGNDLHRNMDSETAFIVIIVPRDNTRGRMATNIKLDEVKKYFDKVFNSLTEKPQ
jgi:hypothetical protein